MHTLDNLVLGRPVCHPAVLLEFHIFGQMNAIYLLVFGVAVLKALASVCVSLLFSSLLFSSLVRFLSTSGADRLRTFRLWSESIVRRLARSPLLSYKPGRARVPVVSISQPTSIMARPEN
ncbi:hypothetical protein D3C84_498040 [compost metagenome]